MQPSTFAFDTSMPTILEFCAILRLPSLLVRAPTPLQLFGLKEDTGSVPRSPSGSTSGGHGLRSSDGRFSNNRPFAYSLPSSAHKGGTHRASDGWVRGC